MTFTPLHQAVGAQPGPITSEMLNELVARAVEEDDNLDFKRALPEQKTLAQSDLAKDIAAFANSGGGVLVFGMAEDSRRATGRVDVGEVSESYERTLRSVAVSHIHPPVFGLELSEVGGDGERALVVVVPASLDGPHLIYRNDYFGAPIRNHADTVWMRERQLEQMYRARFEARDRAAQTIDDLYGEAADGRSPSDRAWLFAVAAPRVPRAGMRPDQAAIKSVVDAAMATARSVDDNWVHPFKSVDYLNPRRGMRRWVLRNAKTSERSQWCEAWVSILDTGAVTIAMAVGGYPNFSNGNPVPGSEVYSKTIECCVLDLLSLIHAMGDHLGAPAEYDLRLGIEWAGSDSLLITTVDQSNFRFTDNSIPLARYTPLRTSIRSDFAGDDLQRQMYEIALDAVNQGGVQYPRLISSPDVE